VDFLRLKIQSFLPSPPWRRAGDEVAPVIDKLNQQGENSLILKDIRLSELT